MSTGRATTAVLVSILLLAALLRFLGLGSGLPHVVGVDEGFEVHRALRLGAGEFDLERDGKGGFFYLLFLEYGVYFVGLLLSGGIGSATEFARSFVADLTPFFMIGRVTHTLVGILTVYWTFRLGRRMYGERAGLFGAAVVALSTIHVARSHYVGVDIPMVLLLLLVLELCQLWTDPRERERPILLGVAFGFTVMHKIVGIVAVVPIVLANWIRHRQGSLVDQVAGRKVLVAYAVAAVVFMVGNPGFVLNLGAFFSEALTSLFGVGVDAASPVSSQVATPNLWLYYARVLTADLGFALFVFALAGVALAVLRRRTPDLLLAGTAAVFYLIIAGAQTSHLFYPRYAIPLIPPLGLLAGRLLDRVVHRLPVPRGWSGWVMACAAALLLAPAALQSGLWAWRQSGDDSRVVARAWFEGNAVPGSAVFMVGNPLVDTAPNLSLPLRNTDANLDHLIGKLGGEEPSKARVLEWRKELASGVKFDLRTVRHFEANGSLQSYLDEGVRYFVLDEQHFGPERLTRDRKHDQEVLDSRARLAEACRNDRRLERALVIDPTARQMTGPAIEVFRVGPSPVSLAEEG